MRNKKLNNATYGKYSCSLPREIPALLQHLNKSRNSTSNRVNGRQSVRDENSIEEDLFESNFLQGKHEYDNEDEVFGDHQRRSDESNTADMGRAISDLASSIVEKDGRELFGGVPSRRVPINSISQSFF